MKKVISLLLVVLLLASVVVSVPMTASAFSPDNFKAQIKKISIGKPITDSDTGKKYLPVDVHIFASENLSDSEAVYFLEGYLKATLADGTQSESIRSLGMTLMGPLKPDVTLDSNMWSWEWTPYDTGGGQGVIKYNVPLLENDETQAVEKSAATGLTEVNGLKVGDSFTIQNETVVNTSGFPEDIVKELFPDGSSVFSDPVTVTIEDEGNYPKVIKPSEEISVTVTVHYKYADGTQAAPDKNETYHEYYIIYNIPSPTIEGYTPDQSEISGLVESNIEYTVTYTKNPADLSKAKVTGVSDDKNKEYTEQEVKNIGLEGLKEGTDYTTEITTEKSDSGEKWVKTFEPIEGKSKGEREVKVKKAPDTVTITVHYVYSDGTQAAPDKTETVKVEFGTIYNIYSPTIEGYTPDKSVIAGSSPDTDMEFTVTYTKNTEPEPAPESKDISLNKATWVKDTDGEGTKVVLEGVIKGNWKTGDAYAKIGGGVTTENWDGIQTGQKDVDTFITDNGDGTSSFKFENVLYWKDSKPSAKDKLGLRISFLNDENKEFVSNELTLSQGETVEKTEEPTTQPATVEPTQPSGDSKEKISVKKAKVSVAKVSAYNGKAKKPAVTVTLNGKKLTYKVDYTVNYFNNKKAGKAKIVIIGQGGYKDSLTVNFKIAKAKNTGKFKWTTAVVKAKKLKNKAQKVASIKVENAKGKVSYKIVKKGTNKKIYKKIKISSNGVIKIKKAKKIKKGTYKIKVKVSVAGNSNYSKKTVTKTLKIKIK